MRILFSQQGRTTAKFLLSVVALALATSLETTVRAASTTLITNYHSWSNVVSVNNGVVEALIVPAIGRVQQFRFAGETDGALWENPRTLGRSSSGGGMYPNFGGDKAWPAPQSVWNWPPPRGFDGMSNTATFENGVITLVTPVDQSFGIRTTRIIELLPGQPVMRIRTIFERVADATRTNSLGIWIDCEATTSAASRCYVPVPKPSIFEMGYTTTGSSAFTAALPGVFTNDNGLISFGVDGRNNHKVGFDSASMLLVGTNLSLRLDAPRIAGATYPDGNCNTEVYTAGSDYFELETLGPLTDLPKGGKMEATTTYTLYHRTEATTDAEAKKLLSSGH